MQQHGWIPDTWCQVKEQDAKDCIPRDSTYTASAEGKVLGLKNRSIVAHRKAGESWLQGSTGDLGAVTLFSSVLLVMWLYMFVKTCSEVRGAQLCPTLCDPMDYTVHGILLARILQWVAIPFSRESSQHRDWTQVSCIAGGFFTSWATREIPKPAELYPLKSEFYSM